MPIIDKAAQLSGFILYLQINNFPTKTSICISLVLATIFFCSCSSGTEHTGAGEATDQLTIPSTSRFDSTLPKGKVKDSIVCHDHPEESYALYLPSYYSIAKKFPCIYFFDAHARGALPICSYQSLAEKYGFVLIGANTSKNGTQWSATSALVKVLMEDTRGRINIDAQRIYTSGFSGGSRVACTIAITDGGIAGVIGCGAGFPVGEQGLQSKFDYFGIVGDHDFNLAEMEKWDITLQQNGFSHQLLITSGMHGWASPADFETALLWMQVNAIKGNRQKKNDTLVSALKRDYSKGIATLKASGEWIKMQKLLSGMVSILDGITDVTEQKKQLAELGAGNEYKNAIAQQAKLQQEELNGQQEMAKQFTTQDVNWWANKIATLNESIRNGKSKQESQMNGRLLAYLGFVAYMNCSAALKTADMEQAAKYLKVFKMADPKNPDHSYLSALYYLQKGSTKEAIASLNEATALGFNDVVQLLAEPAFSSLKNGADFQKVVAKAKENCCPK